MRISDFGFSHQAGYDMQPRVSIAVAMLGVLPLIFATAAEPRLVIVDQDGSGPGGSNQMSMLALLQSTNVQVLGITIVTGNAWRDEEVQHTLRMLELVQRIDVPVIPGAVYPLVRTRAETMLWLKLYGKVPWLGPWREKALEGGTAVHDPAVVPRLAEGAPRIKPLNE